MKFLLYAIKVQIFIFYGKVSRTRTSIGGKKGWVFWFGFFVKEDNVNCKIKGLDKGGCSY